MKKILEFIALCLIGLALGYVIILGVDKEAQYNENKAMNWQTQRANASFNNGIQK